MGEEKRFGEPVVITSKLSFQLDDGEDIPQLNWDIDEETQRRIDELEKRTYRLRFY